jgi:protein translocase SecG subunit
MYTFLLIIFVIAVILIIPLILMQSGSGADAGMFGSDLTLGAFGAKSSEVLLKFTRWLVAIFMFAAFMLGYLKVIEKKNLAAQPTQTMEQGQPEGAGETAPQEPTAPAGQPLTMPDTTPAPTTPVQ